MSSNKNDDQYEAAGENPDTVDAPRDEDATARTRPSVDTSSLSSQAAELAEKAMPGSNRDDDSESSGSGKGKKSGRSKQGQSSSKSEKSDKEGESDG